LVDFIQVTKFMSCDFDCITSSQIITLPIHNKLFKRKQTKDMKEL
jgi:hypothetical protein